MIKEWISEPLMFTCQIFNFHAQRSFLYITFPLLNERSFWMTVHINWNTKIYVKGYLLDLSRGESKFEKWTLSVKRQTDGTFWPPNQSWLIVKDWTLTHPYVIYALKIILYYSCLQNSMDICFLVNMVCVMVYN